jgi:hypothetical protein
LDTQFLTVVFFVFLLWVVVSCCLSIGRLVAYQHHNRPLSGPSLSGPLRQV